MTLPLFSIPSSFSFLLKLFNKLITYVRGFFFKRVLAILLPLPFHIDVRISLFISTKMFCWNFDWKYLKSGLDWIWNNILNKNSNTILNQDIVLNLCRGEVTYERVGGLSLYLGLYCLLSAAFCSFQHTNRVQVLLDLCLSLSLLVSFQLLLAHC